MHILVTGATGRIGANLVKALLARGHTVRGFVYPGDASRTNKLDGWSNVEVVTGDLRSFEQIAAACDGVEAIFHLAAAFGGPWDHLDRLDLNARGTLNILEAVRRSGAPIHRMLYASTEAVYWRLGASGRLFERPIEETDVSPTHSMPYFLTKWIGEELWMNYGLQYRLPTVTTRFATVFEPSEFLNEDGLPVAFRMKPVLEQYRALRNPTAEQQRVLADLEAQWDGSEKLLISRSPDGRSYMQHWCDVRDIVQGLVRALESPEAAGEVFNLAGVRVVWERDVPWLAERCGAGVAEVRRETPNYFTLSIEKARRLLGYEPQHDLASVFAAARAYRRGEANGIIPCGVRWGPAPERRVSAQVG